MYCILKDYTFFWTLIFFLGLVTTKTYLILQMSSIIPPSAREFDVRGRDYLLPQQKTGPSSPWVFSFFSVPHISCPENSEVGNAAFVQKRSKFQQPGWVAEAAKCIACQGKLSLSWPLQALLPPFPLPIESRSKDAGPASVNYWAAPLLQKDTFGNQITYSKCCTFKYWPKLDQGKVKTSQQSINFTIFHKQQMLMLQEVARRTSSFLGIWAESWFNEGLVPGVLALAPNSSPDCPCSFPRHPSERAGEPLNKELTSDCDTSLPQSKLTWGLFALSSPPPHNSLSMCVPLSQHQN